MKRAKNLFEKIISDENLSLAIDEVNRTHRWHKRHKPNGCTAWVELTKPLRIEQLRKLIVEGFVPNKPRISRRWDVSAQKWRNITEPKQYPDQYVHHALIQVLQPVFMKGMDNYCCGSIRGRGTQYGKKAIERWVRKDRKGTKYCLSCDIRHFYDSLLPDVVMDRMRHLIKDHRTLDLIERIIKDGISIGAYTSQWFANTTLQPLDRLIRQDKNAKHSIRYMDNITVFGSNKRKLRQLRAVIENWLNEHGMKLKGDHQVFPTAKRLPNAMGYRFGKDYTIPRKHNLLRLKRAATKFIKQRECKKRVPVKRANSIMSRLGQLKHCNNYRLYKLIFRGYRLIRELKTVIRADARKERLSWSMFLEMTEATKHYALKTANILSCRVLSQ